MDSGNLEPEVTLDSKDLSVVAFEGTKRKC